MSYGVRIISRDPELQSRDTDFVTRDPELESRDSDFQSRDPKIKNNSRGTNGPPYKTVT